VKDKNENEQRGPERHEEASSDAQPDSNQHQAFISDDQRPPTGKDRKPNKIDKKVEKEYHSDTGYGSPMNLPNEEIDEAIEQHSNDLPRLRDVDKAALQEQEESAEETMPE
jgi:hypothetical protein